MRASAFLAIVLGAFTLPSLALAPVARAQESPGAPRTEARHFKLLYRFVQIGEGAKATDSHSYTTIIATEQDHVVSSIRVGDKFPIATGSTSSGNTEFQYQDIGIGIDTSHAGVNGRQLSLHVSARYSTVGSKVTIGTFQEPIFRQLNWESDVVVTLDKPTVIFTSDNVTDTGKTELEVTATEIKEP
jgi:hypothetical protein